MTWAFTFFISTKNSLTWGVKCKKLNSKKKIVGNLLPSEASKIVHEWNGHDHLEIFSRPQVIENYRQASASPNMHFTKNIRWMPPI